MVDSARDWRADLVTAYADLFCSTSGDSPSAQAWPAVGDSRADILMGRDENGRAGVSGEILWIGADQSYAVCEDGLWWTPGEE